MIQQVKNNVKEKGEEGKETVLFTSSRDGDDLTAKDCKINLELVRPIRLRPKDTYSINGFQKNSVSYVKHCAAQRKRETPVCNVGDLENECATNRPKRLLSSTQFNTSATVNSTQIQLSSGTLKRPRTTSENPSSSSLVVETEEALDQRLSEELEVEAPRTPSPSSFSLIPLLTPPQSPRRQSIVEWPSNLVVDSALMAVANDIRPLSPASLMEESEAADEIRKYENLMEQTCGLTRRLSFIRMGKD